MNSIASLKLLFLLQLLFLSSINGGVISKRETNEIIANTPQIDESTTTTVPTLVDRTEVPDNNNDDATTTASPITNNQTDDHERFRFDFNRYTSPSNYSNGIHVNNDTEQILSRYFEEKQKNITEIESTTTFYEDLRTENADFPTTTRPILDSNLTMEKNSTLLYNNFEIESTNYEIGTNEIKNGTNVEKTTEKRAKFLNQFGNNDPSDNNDINYRIPNAAEVWALASMLNVEHTRNSSGQLKNESTEIIKKNDEPIGTNNTLKQLTDWTEIMKNMDFANSSYINNVANEADGNFGKDNRDSDAMAAENKFTAIIAETTTTTTSTTTTTPAPPTVAEDDNTVDRIETPKMFENLIATTPIKNLVLFIPEPTTEDTLEDFKFFEKTEEIPEKSTTTVPSPKTLLELTNYIIDTTMNSRADAFTTVNTLTTGGYQVSESVNEDEEDFIQAIVTTERNEVTTDMEDSTTFIPLPSSTTTTTQEPMSTTTTPSTTSTTEASQTTSEIIRTTRETITTTTQMTTEPTPTTVFPEIEEETTPVETTTILNNPTTEAAVDAVINELTQTTNNSNEEESTESEANTTIQNREPATTETSIKVEIDELRGQQSTIIPNYIEIKPLTTTEAIDSTLETNHIDRTTEAIQTTQKPEAVEILDNDDKNKYNTVKEITTTKPPPIDESSPKVTMEAMPEDESATDDDYVLVSIAPSTTNLPLEGNGESEGSNTGVIIAITASVVGVIAIILLIVVLFVLKKRQNQVTYGQRCRPVGLDAYSLDNVSVYNSVRRKGNTMRLSKRSYGNSAFEDPGLRTNSLTVVELAIYIQNKSAIYDEFKEIPQITVRSDEVPDGCEDRNRYANVIPLPETRVHLNRLNNDDKTEYINANFVKGPKDAANYYIACQAPMENTVTDFWRMIWEQKSKVIIMATDLSENGVEKCADYLPPSVVLDCNRTFGDFHITLKNREMKDKYSVSTVHLKNAQTNTWREIIHFWYQWPDTGVPVDESTVISMLLEARSYQRSSPPDQSDDLSVNATQLNNNNNVNNSNNNTNTDNLSITTNGGTIDKFKSLQKTPGLITVHCSPGTGRTGTIIACDVVLRTLEIPPRNIDVPQVVYTVRRGRASSVRTREQYEFIYRVGHVYATKLTGPHIEN